jgi:xanthine dehydrogenase accessory factor
MSQSLLEIAYQLTQAGEPFVLATVVWCERPTSAKPGAQAIIKTDGQMIGWIGGSCAQPVVLREAARILREGSDPYLLRLGISDSQPARDNNDIRMFPMSCTSGGVLEIYMEPHFPQPQLILVGESPVIAALSRLAPVLNMTTSQLNHPDLGQSRIDERTFILVASHGQYDEDALEQALRSPACYIGMVGSKKRAASVREYLRTSGLTEAEIARLKAPAGLDVGAVTPEEIAASILAELVQVRRQRSSIEEQRALDAQSVEHMPRETSDHADAAVETALDPVCGMMVEIASARHHSILDNQEFYFCCPACKRLFERNPQEYLVRDER